MENSNQKEETPALRETVVSSSVTKGCNNSEILDVVREFMREKGLMRRFSKWVETLELDDDEEYDLKEWADTLERD